MEVIDISSLNERYGINRNAVNDRINTLNIKRSRRGKISPEDLVLMDKYHEHVQKGGTILNFPLSPEVVVPDKVLDVANNGSSELLFCLCQAMESIACNLAFVKAESNPIKNMQLLQEAAREHYILSTKQLKDLCGVKPYHNHVYGKFRIVRAEVKVGKSFGWAVVDIKLEQAIKQTVNKPTGQITLSRV